MEIAHKVAKRCAETRVASELYANVAGLQLAEMYGP